jgi:4-hydroxy-tetrahydrodipicolinate synthase
MKMMILIVVLLVLLSNTSNAFTVSSSCRSRYNRLSLSMISPVKGGSVVALVTPMKEGTNAIDYDKFVELLEWHVKEGTDGAVILGTTGEGSMVNMDERTEVIKTAVKTVKGAMPIIIGTGTIETHKVIELTRNAKDNGADASLIITPYYVKPPQRALVKHFLDVANAVSLPMIVYNCPGRTGVDMKPETIAELKHKMIIGVKDATGDLSRVESIRKLCGKDFLIFSGEDDSGCDFVRIGGDGVISVTANVAPGPMHNMLKWSKEGKKDDAEAINQSLMPLHQRLFLESNPIPAKKVLQLMGKIGTGIRPPLTNLSNEHLQKLQEAMMIGKLSFKN